MELQGEKLVWKVERMDWKNVQDSGTPEDNPKRCNSSVFEVPGGKEDEDGPEEVLEEKWLKNFLIWQNASTFRFKKLRKSQTE